MEGVRSSGELTFEAECFFSQFHTQVQRGAGTREGYFGGQSGSTAGQDFTCVYFPSLSICLQGVQLTGKGEVIGSLEGVWDGFKSGPPPHQLLVPIEDFTKFG